MLIENIENIEDLLALYDQEFVGAALQIFPDHAKRQKVALLYLSLIRRGHDKEGVLYQIISSSDTAVHGFRLFGSRQFVAQVERRNRLFPGLPFKIAFLFRQHRLRANSVENLLGRLLLALESPGAAPALQLERDSGPTESIMTDKAHEALSPKAAQIFDRLRFAARH